MSKKDFIATADVINDVLHSYKSDSLTIKRVVLGLSNRYARLNPRFDRDRFIEACLKDLT